MQRKVQRVVELLHEHRHYQVDCEQFVGALLSLSPHLVLLAFSGKEFVGRSSHIQCHPIYNVRSAMLVCCSKTYCTVWFDTRRRNCERELLERRAAALLGARLLRAPRVAQTRSGPAALRKASGRNRMREASPIHRTQSSFNWSDTAILLQCP